MKKYRPILLMVIIVTGLLMAAPLYGQCPEHSGNKGAPVMKFTPEQEKQMTDMKTTLLKETDPIKTELKVKSIELMTLWNDENPDGSKILAKVKEIGALKLKLQEKMINHKLAMMKILTPEQRKMMKGMMGMGGGCCNCCDFGEKCGMMGGSGCGKGMHGGKGETGCGGCGK